jgi:hypothetical protein
MFMRPCMGKSLINTKFVDLGKFWCVVEVSTPSHSDVWYSGHLMNIFFDSGRVSRIVVWVEK